MKRFLFKFILLLLLALFLLYKLFTIFVVVPEAGVSSGEIIVVGRGAKMNFIDSPESLCQRMGTPSKSCRKTALHFLEVNDRVYYRFNYTNKFDMFIK